MSVDNSLTCGRLREEILHIVLSLNEVGSNRHPWLILHGLTKHAVFNAVENGNVEPSSLFWARHERQQFRGISYASIKRHQST